MAKQKTEVHEEIEGIDGGGGVLVRVLYTCELGDVNAVIPVSADELEILQRAGYVDADPNAVAYAQSLIAPKP